MKKILESMSLDEAKAFTVSKGFKYLNDFLVEAVVTNTESLIKTFDTNHAFKITGELSAAKGMIRLLKAFENPEVKPETPAPNGTEAFQNQKPESMMKPIELPE